MKSITYYVCTVYVNIIIIIEVYMKYEYKYKYCTYVHTYYILRIIHTNLHGIWYLNSMYTKNNSSYYKTC